MFEPLHKWLFGCWHSNYSFPITAKVGSRSEAAQVTGIYVVCLDCGKEFPYDWKEMKVVSTQRIPDAVAQPVAEPALEPALER